MNPRIKRIAIAAVGGLLFVGLAAMVYTRVYAEPMGKARAELDRHRRATRAYERDLDAASGVNTRLREVASTTLGKTEEEVAHRFRTLLHGTARAAGLSGITISEGRTAAELNPATSQFRLQGFRSEDRRTIDFAVMNGEIRGVGALESVARLLELCDAQSWIHRVASFSVTPTGEDRNTFDVRVSVATLILPDLGPPPDAEFAVTPLAPGSESAWAAIVSKNVFRIPDPPAVAEAPVIAVAPPPQVADTGPPPPPPPAYHEWRLVGVMEGTSGTRVVMSHPTTGLSAVIGIGEAVLDARLSRAGAEEAIFAIQDVEYVVRLGQSLADRQIVDEWQPD